MAAVTTAIVAGTGVLMSFYGMQQQGKAAKRAGKLNAQDAEENARLAMERAKEDERQFRLTFRRDQASNVAAIGASGVRREGSPLEVLQDNAASAENDAINIRRGGEQQRASYLRQASQFRSGARAAANAANIQGAATLLSGAASTYMTGRTAGAWGKA
jgi:hypothetical protein